MNDDHISHGTRAGYQYWKCRCLDCRAAIRIYMRGLRAKHLTEMRADPQHRRHGTDYGYQCGCRCLKCTDEKSRLNTFYRGRR